MKPVACTRSHTPGLAGHDVHLHSPAQGRRRRESQERCVAGETLAQVQVSEKDTTSTCTVLHKVDVGGSRKSVVYAATRLRMEAVLFWGQTPASRITHDRSDIDEKRVAHVLPKNGGSLAARNARPLAVDRACLQTHGCISTLCRSVRKDEGDFRTQFVIRFT